MNAIDWLKTCCSSDPERPHLGQPFPVKARRARYAAATDGRIVLFVPKLAVPEPKHKPPMLAELVADKSFAAALTVVSLAELRAWAECDASGLVMKPCLFCDGSGWWKCASCEGTGIAPHDCYCKFCYRDDEGECGECEGKKRFECDECDGKGQFLQDPDPLPGRLLGLPIDRRLVYRVIRDAPGDAVRIGRRGELDPVAFVGTGWRALVMPIRGDEACGAEHDFDAAWRREP